MSDLQGFGIKAEQLDGFKPGFVAVQTTMLEMHKAKLAGEGVDAYFAKKALTDNKPQQYLETLDFQLALMANMGVGQEEQFIQLMLGEKSTIGEVNAAIDYSLAAGRFNCVGYSVVAR